jgi:excisionase family DNA binding protein
MEDKQYMTPKELASILKVSPMTISHWTKARKIKARKTRGMICIPIKEANRLIAEIGEPDTFFDRIYDAVEDRLDQPGVISAKSVYELCNDLPYETVRDVIRKIMNVMLIQNKAVKVRNGQWKIIRPNRRKLQVAA